MAVLVDVQQEADRRDSVQIRHSEIAHPRGMSPGAGLLIHGVGAVGVDTLFGAVPLHAEERLNVSGSGAGRALHEVGVADGSGCSVGRQIHYCGGSSSRREDERTQHDRNERRYRTTAQNTFSCLAEKSPRGQLLEKPILDDWEPRPCVSSRALRIARSPPGRQAGSGISRNFPRFVGAERYMSANAEYVRSGRGTAWAVLRASRSERLAVP